MVRVDRPEDRRDGLRPRLRHRRLPGPVATSTWPGRATSDITTADQLETLKQRTFYGREKDNLIYPIALANLVLHGIDEPHIWHGNTLTGSETYGGLFDGRARRSIDVVLTNPPFGGKEGKEAQTRFAYKTGATQVLFLQHVIDSLKPGGRCGIVLDEGVLFRTNETAFVQTKRKLLDDCDLWCIVSLPGGRLHRRRRGRQDQPAVLHQGRADRADLVLRPVGHQGRQEDARSPWTTSRSSSGCCRTAPTATGAGPSPSPSAASGR